MVAEADKTEVSDRTWASTIWFRHLPPWVLPLALGPGLVLLVFVELPVCMGGRTRELSLPRTCPRNLRGVGSAVELYSIENEGFYPLDWTEFLKQSRCSPWCLVCPDSGTTRAKYISPLDLEGHVDYVFVSGADDRIRSDIVRSFELPSNHRQQIVNVLHLSGYVSRPDDFSEFMLQLQQTNDQLAAIRKKKGL